MSKIKYKEIAYEMAEKMTMALIKLQHTSDWVGTLRNHKTGESYTWEESFARSLERLPGFKIDRRWLEAKYLPAKQRRAEWAKLRKELSSKGLETK